MSSSVYNLQINIINSKLKNNIKGSRWAQNELVEVVTFQMRDDTKNNREKSQNHKVLERENQQLNKEEKAISIIRE